jgi:ubiquinone/menaquinone biosynthesis C-methylase UbiE
VNEPLYVCGHSARELRRLEVQADFYEDITRRFLLRAGLAAGMRVLDLGCGVGDVAFIAAEIVGPAGSVVGIDRSAEAIEWATTRARERTAPVPAFHVGEIDHVALEPVDALIGRFVLMHQPDPARALKRAARCVRPGGVVAVLESHLDAWVTGVHSHPHSQSYERAIGWMMKLIRAAGAHTDMGLRLRPTFIDAGLPAPRLCFASRVEGGPNAAIYHYTAESLRSMASQAHALGIEAPSVHEIDALEDTLREETVAGGGVLVAAPVVSAWCHH